MLNSKMFSLIDTFFNKSAQVESLETGALKFGGATKINKNTIVSNFYDSDLIEVNKDRNTLSLYIPSTINYNENIDNSKYVNEYLSKIVFRYGIDDISIFNTQGSYLTDDKEVIKEDITIISLNLKEVKKDDIDFFLILADMVKNEMVQYGVSVQINNCLAIV